MAVDKQTLKKQRTQQEYIESLDDYITVKLLKQKALRQWMKKADNIEQNEDLKFLADAIQEPDLTLEDLQEVDSKLYMELQQAVFRANGLGEEQEDTKKN
jgi:hypothetical protein